MRTSQLMPLLQSLGNVQQYHQRILSWLIIMINPLSVQAEVHSTNQQQISRTIWAVGDQSYSFAQSLVLIWHKAKIMKHTMKNLTKNNLQEKTNCKTSFNIKRFVMIKSMKRQAFFIFYIKFKHMIIIIIIKKSQEFNLEIPLCMQIFLLTPNFFF